MCRFEYQSDSSKACPYTGLFKVLRSAGYANNLTEAVLFSNVSLPLDNEGLCLFHSVDCQFKTDLSMNDSFKELIKALRWGNKNKVINNPVLDFEGCSFFGENKNIGDDRDPIMMVTIDFSELELTDCASFENCKFHDPTWFSYTKFHRAAKFDGAIFYDSADFSNADFKAKISFDNVTFTQGVIYNSTSFYASASFENAIFKGSAAFHESVFKGYASFKDADFESAYFTGVSFIRPDGNTMVNFQDATFDKFIRIQQSEFTGEVNFTGATLNQGEFIDTVFSQDKPTIFDNIILDGKLVIKSTDYYKKVFNYLVSFNISVEKIKGDIVFENTNVYFIKESNLLKQLSLPPLNKVVFGPGCDKYKLKKEFTVPMSSSWYFLIQEMADSFVAFFNWARHVQLSISVECEYFEDHVLVRYYADATMDDLQFEQVLAENVPNFYDFLKDPNAYMRRHQEVRPATEETIGADIDIYRKLYSLRTGIAARVAIAENGWGPQETLNLLKALSENPELKLAIEFNNYVVNQKDFFSFGNKKLISAGDIHYNTENRG